MVAENDLLLNAIGLDTDKALKLPTPLRKKVTSFLLSLGVWAEAKPLLEADSEEVSRGLRERAKLAKAYTRAGDIAKAEELCGELAGEYGGQPLTLAAQGDLFTAKGEYAAAINCYREMLVRNPSNPDAWCHIARTCQVAGRWKDSEEYCRRALAEHLRRKGSPGGFAARETERRQIPTHLLRLLHRQAAGAGRPAEAEAIAKELDTRCEDAIERIKRMLQAFYRSGASSEESDL